MQSQNCFNFTNEDDALYFANRKARQGFNFKIEKLKKIGSRWTHRVYFWGAAPDGSI